MTDPKLAKSQFVTCPLHTLTVDDIKLPKEEDSEYFRKLPIELNPIALGWRCVSHPPATTECAQAVSGIKTLTDVSMGSWWIDDKGFLHFLVWAAKKDKDGAVECRPSVLRRPAKPVVQALFCIKPNQATHQSARRDEIRASGGFQVDPQTGEVTPLAPSQLLVPQPPPSAVANITVNDEHIEAAQKKNENALGHLGLPPAPRIPPTPKQAASNPPSPATLATQCKAALHTSVKTEAAAFNELFSIVIGDVQNKKTIPGLTKTKGLRDPALQVIDKTKLVLPFPTATIRLARFAMVLACKIPEVRLSSYDGNFLMRPDAIELLDMWPRYTANSAPARKPARPGTGGADFDPNCSSLDHSSSSAASKPTPVQEPVMSKPAAKIIAPATATPKLKPTPPAAAAAAASDNEDFLVLLSREISVKQCEGNFFYESGRCFANRAIEKKAVHPKLVGMAKDALHTTGLFDPTSDVMKSAADVRASQLPARKCDWKNVVDNAFMLFGLIPAMLAVKGFMDNGGAANVEQELAALRTEAAELSAERAKLSAELTTAKRRNEELEDELEEARKAPKVNTLDLPADV